MQFYRWHALFRIRKSAWIALLLLVVFSVLRFSESSKTKTLETAPPSPTEISWEDTLSLAFCKGIVDNRMFGVDSEFEVGRDRVFAIVQGLADEQLEMVWYAGGEERARIWCNPFSVCQSSLGPDSLTLGNWSVDVVHDRKLIVSRQFRMLAK